MGGWAHAKARIPLPRNDLKCGLRRYQKGAEIIDENIYKEDRISSRARGDGMRGLMGFSRMRSIIFGISIM